MGKKRNSKINNRKFVSKAQRHRAHRGFVDSMLRQISENPSLAHVRTDGAVIRDAEGYSASQRQRDYTPSLERRAGRERTVRGVFSGVKDGSYGFVTPSDDSYTKDIFIPSDKTGGAIDLDVVDVSFTVFHNNRGEEKTEGRVTKIVEQVRKVINGTLVVEQSRRRNDGYAYLIPDEAKIPLRPIVVERLGARSGDKVALRLVRKEHAHAYGNVITNFGRAGTHGANYNAILSECEITTEFTEAQLREAEFFAAMPISDEGRVRRDADVIFTIDGEGAKDLDDAISLRRLRDGKWRLGVHIADVSYYVKEHTHLDRAVMARGTSVYFTDKVVPMLPPALSNGACSLNPNEEKYALSAMITLDADGEILKVDIEKSIIVSRVRGVYSEVNRIFDGTASDEILKKYKAVLPSLRRMHELYLVLQRKSAMRGALELDLPECEIELSDDGRPISISKRARGDGEKLIEQFMLTANEAVAAYLRQKNIPCIYRVHDNPPENKLASFLEYVHSLGIGADKISVDKCTPRRLSDMLSVANERGIGEQISYVLLRSMAKARYSEQHAAHFGLGIENYCHFTSPIRRLSDLATHRIIHRVLFDGKRAELYQPYARRAAAAATEAELRAQNAERRIEDLYKAVYMSDFVGEIFEGRISSVTSFGFFVELDNACEGLVPLSSLGGVFSYDEPQHKLRSRYRTYSLCDRVLVRLEEADIAHGKLRFDVVEGE